MPRLIQKTREAISRFESNVANEMPSPVARGFFYSGIPTAAIGASWSVSGVISEFTPLVQAGTVLFDYSAVVAAAIGCYSYIKNKPRESPTIRTC